jgi:predicted Fe-S protein YdhL (DUF1289 family)
MYDMHAAYKEDNEDKDFMCMHCFKKLEGVKKWTRSSSLSKRTAMRKLDHSPLGGIEREKVEAAKMEA